MTKEDFLFMLIRAALWDWRLKGEALPHPQFAALVKEAEKQTVKGLMFQIFLNPDNGVRLGKYDAAEVYSSMMEVTTTNEKVNRELKELVMLLQSHEIHFVVVKGQTLAALYSHPLNRTSGDIDFYVVPNDFERAKVLIEKEWLVEFETDEDDGEQDQHIAFNRNDVEFEMHFELMKFQSEKVQKVFDRMIDTEPSYREVVGVMVPILNPEAELLYTFLHAFHHFIELGIGLRQICDIAILLNQRVVDKDKVNRWLKELDFERGFMVFEAICVDKLRLPKECLPVAIDEVDKKRMDEVLNVVFKRGNFGKYGRKNAVRSGIAYYIESFKLKIIHYIRFYSLCPREARATLFGGIPRKILMAVRR